MISSTTTTTYSTKKVSSVTINVHLIGFSVPSIVNLHSYFLSTRKHLYLRIQTWVGLEVVDFCTNALLGSDLYQVSPNYKIHQSQTYALVDHCSVAKPSGKAILFLLLLVEVRRMRR